METKKGWEIDVEKGWKKYVITDYTAVLRLGI